MKHRYQTLCSATLTLCFWNSIETELAQAVDRMISQAKKIYILMIKVDKLFSFFVTEFSIRNGKNVFCVFIEFWYKSVCCR